MKVAHRIPAGPANESSPGYHSIDVGTARSCHKEAVGEKEGYCVCYHEAELNQDQHILPEAPVLPAQCHSQLMPGSYSDQHWSHCLTAKEDRGLKLQVLLENWQSTLISFSPPGEGPGSPATTRSLMVASTRCWKMSSTLEIHAGSECYVYAKVKSCSCPKLISPCLPCIIDTHHLVSSAAMVCWVMGVSRLEVQSLQRRFMPMHGHCRLLITGMGRTCG